MLFGEVQKQKIGALELLLRKRIKRINEKMQMTSTKSAEQSAEQLSQINTLKGSIRALRKRDPGNTYEEAIRWMQIDNTTVPALRRRLRDKKVATDKGLIRSVFVSSVEQRNY